MPPLLFRVLHARSLCSLYYSGNMQIDVYETEKYNQGMKIIGIDLSGPRNFADTCLVSFEERGDEIHLVEVREGANDDQILEAVSSVDTKERIVIGIDAPLSYNST